MSEEDQEQKTEQPTQKRLDEAYKKGNLPNSREIGNFMLLGFLALLVAGLAPYMMHTTAMLLSPLLSEAGSLPTDRRGLGELFTRIAFGSLSILAAPFVGGIAVAIAANVLQNGFVLTNEPLMPQLSRISPMAGMKRLFSMRSVVELLKGMTKIGIVGYVAFIAVYPELEHIRQLPNSDARALLIFLAILAGRMTIGVAVAMFFIALLDLMYQRFQFTKSLRMTKQEIRDEYKQSEGDPHIKARLRRLRQERARNRMMANVPKADVVVTNPTHFSIALLYESGRMKAPTIVAMGQDLIALKIREIAKENDVPLVENPPLARALFANGELDKEIPLEHYEAVAKVISYVYQLKGRKI